MYSIKGGGIYNYLVKLLPRLIEKAKASSDQLILLNLYFRKKGSLPDSISEKYPTLSFRFPVKLLNHFWIKYSFPDMSLFFNNIDIVHSPHFSLPVMSRTKKILTVNDITYLKYPEYFRPADRKLNDYGYKKLLPVNIKRADRIIAISQHTKDELLDYFKIPPEKVSVVHIGCDIPPQYSHDDINKKLAKYNLIKDEFIYFPVGSIEPRKNINRTVTAFSKTKSRKIKLVISGVGNSDWLKAIDTTSVIMLQWDNESDKNALFQGSLFVVYPSLYEGFGMPLVEAMGNGKAVLTSNTTSLKEISGGAAFTVNPENIDEIINGFNLLINNNTLRSDLEIKSLTRAKCFTWDKMTDSIYDVYKSTQ